MDPACTYVTGQKPPNWSCAGKAFLTSSAVRRDGSSSGSSLVGFMDARRESVVHLVELGLVLDREIEGVQAAVSG